jgi:uncharacterized membrane protein YbhN (UPF0104 family)
MELTSQPGRPTGLLAFAREIGAAQGEAEHGRRARLLPLAWLAAGALLALLLARNGGQFLHALDRALHDGWKLVVLGALLEAASIAGYIVLQHRVIGAADRRIRPKDSYDIALAGTAATRLLPTAGLGGAAVTAWVLRARGVRGGEIAERLLTFLLLIYAVYMAALLIFGAAVGFGLVHVAAGQALGAVAAGLALLISGAAVTLLAAPQLTAALLRRAAGTGRLAHHAERVVQELPALRCALRRVVVELRHPRPAHLGAIAWWGFDIGVLVAMLHAFGAPLPIPVVVLAYFLGTMFNLLPLPGSLSGGLAGTLVVFGAPAAPALAAVMAYRTIAVWLPAGSGVVSLLALRATVARWRTEGPDTEAALVPSSSLYEAPTRRAPSGVLATRPAQAPATGAVTRTPAHLLPV